VFSVSLDLASDLDFAVVNFEEIPDG